MLCSIKEVQRRVSVVTYRDEVGHIQGRILPAHVTHGYRIGDQIEISRDVLEEGIEYGQELDFEILLGGPLIIDPKDIRDAMRAHGIWTPSDLELKAKEVHAAIQSVVSMVQGRLVKEMRHVLGG